MVMQVTAAAQFRKKCELLEGYVKKNESHPLAVNRMCHRSTRLRSVALFLILAVHGGDPIA